MFESFHHQIGQFVWPYSKKHPKLPKVNTYFFEPLKRVQTTEKYRPREGGGRGRRKICQGSLFFCHHAWLVNLPRPTFVVIIQSGRPAMRPFSCVPVVSAAYQMSFPKCPCPVSRCTLTLLDSFITNRRAKKKNLRYCTFLFSMLWCAALEFQEQVPLARRRNQPDETVSAVFTGDRIWRQFPLWCQPRKQTNTMSEVCWCAAGQEVIQALDEFSCVVRTSLFALHPLNNRRRPSGLFPKEPNNSTYSNGDSHILESGQTKCQLWMLGSTYSNDGMISSDRKRVSHSVSEWDHLCVNRSREEGAVVHPLRRESLHGVSVVAAVGNPCKSPPVANNGESSQNVLAICFAWKHNSIYDPIHSRNCLNGARGVFWTMVWPSGSESLRSSWQVDRGVTGTCLCKFAAHVLNETCRTSKIMMFWACEIPRSVWLERWSARNLGSFAQLIEIMYCPTRCQELLENDRTSCSHWTQHPIPDNLEPFVREFPWCVLWKPLA